MGVTISISRFDSAVWLFSECFDFSKMLKISPPFFLSQMNQIHPCSELFIHYQRWSGGGGARASPSGQRAKGGVAGCRSDTHIMTARDNLASPIYLTSLNSGKSGWTSTLTWEHRKNPEIPGCPRNWTQNSFWDATSATPCTAMTPIKFIS